MSKNIRTARIAVFATLSLLAGCGKESSEPRLGSESIVSFPDHSIQFRVPQGWHVSSLRDIRTDIFVGAAQAHNDGYTKNHPERSCFLVSDQLQSVICVIPGSDFVKDNPAEQASHVRRGIESGRSAAFLAWLLHGRLALDGNAQFSIQQKRVGGREFPCSIMTGDEVVLVGFHAEKQWLRQRLPITVGIACRPNSLADAEAVAGMVLQDINRGTRITPVSPVAHVQERRERTAPAAVDKRPLVGVMSSLPVLGSSADNGSLPPWFSFAFLESSFQWRTIVPPLHAMAMRDIAALVLVGPPELDATTVDMVLKYVSAGGRVLLFLDPLCMAQFAVTGAGNSSTNNLSHDAHRLLAEWGVSFDPNLVLSDRGAGTRLRSASGNIEVSPFLLSLTSDHITKNMTFTNKMTTLLLPYCGAVKVAERHGRKVTEFVTSSPMAFLALKDAAMSGRSEERPDGEATHVIAAAIRGGFGGAEDHTGMVVIVGDVDCLYDPYCAQEAHGTDSRRPINDNVELLYHLVQAVTSEE